MSNLVKFISIAAMSTGLSAIVAIPAHALSVIAPAYEDRVDTRGPAYNSPPVAFTREASGTANQDNLSLSSQEIMHVRWCAKQYMSYHPSDNSYKTRNGSRVECRSPY